MHKDICTHHRTQNIQDFRRGEGFCTIVDSPRSDCQKHYSKKYHHPSYQANNNPTVKVKIIEEAFELAWRGKRKMHQELLMYCGMKSRKINGYFTDAEFKEQFRAVYFQIKEKFPSTSTLYDRTGKMIACGFVTKTKNGYQLNSYDTVWDMLYFNQDKELPKKLNIIKVEFTEAFIQEVQAAISSQFLNRQQIKASKNITGQNRYTEILSDCTGYNTEPLKMAYNTGKVTISGKRYSRLFGRQSRQWGSKEMRENPFIKKDPVQKHTFSFRELGCKNFLEAGHLEHHLYKAFDKIEQCAYKAKFYPFYFNHIAGTVSFFTPGDIEILTDAYAFQKK